MLKNIASPPAAVSLMLIICNSPISYLGLTSLDTGVLIKFACELFCPVCSSLSFFFPSYFWGLFHLTAIVKASGKTKQNNNNINKKDSICGLKLIIGGKAAGQCFPWVDLSSLSNQTEMSTETAVVLSVRCDAVMQFWWSSATAPAESKRPSARERPPCRLLV